MKSVSFANVPREPHCSPEVWLIEPFDEELDLWTLGSRYGFVWALLPGEPTAPRCRSLSRADGVKELKDLLREDHSDLVLAGGVHGDAVEIEWANFLIQFDRDTSVDLAEYPGALLARVVDRLRELQYYDGDQRVRQFEEDGESGAGCVCESFFRVTGVAFG